MAIPLPNLDDRSFAELTAEAQAMIPSLYPGWSNYNPSDPGIVLIELLAWLTEMLMFQVNQIPEANTEKFLKLLNAPNWTRPAGLSLDEATRQTMRRVRERYRAITPDDYEHLALHDWPHSDEAAQLIKDTAQSRAAQLRRVKCVPRRNLEEPNLALRAEPAPAHISLVVVPEPAANESTPTPTDTLRNALSSFFRSRRALTTQHHIVGPGYVEIGIGANLAVHEDAPLNGGDNDVRKQARASLSAFFHPLTGGPAGTGWPFGRAVYVSEIYAVLEKVGLVNYVEDVQLAASAERLLKQGDDVIGVTLDAHELVKLLPASNATKLVAYDAYGQSYTEAVGA